MANRLYTRLALAAATVLFFAAPSMAQQRPLGANQLPASGVVNYQGTFTSTDFSVPIQFTVDFSTGSVQGFFTIPPLTVNGGATNGYSGQASGNIDAEGSFLLVYPSGIFVAQPGVSVAVFLAGNFFNAQARNIAGVFITQFCLNATTVPCPGVVARSGSYEATRVP
jgi:hypothetical protein